MRIFVLEDDDSRFAKMRWQLNGVVTRALDVKNAIKLLEEHDFDLIMLDHDLSEEHYELYEAELFGKKVESYKDQTGMRVAEWLAEHKKDCPVIVHSLNKVARPVMLKTLEEAGYRAIDGAFCWYTSKEEGKTIPEYFDIE